MIETKTNMINSENCKCETQIKGSPKNVMIELAVLIDGITKEIAAQVDEPQILIITQVMDAWCDLTGEEE